MKKSIAKLWIKALRSGEFKQGIGTLESKQGELCCLGVLCNLALVEGICGYYNDSDKPIYFDESSALLPDSVKLWARMNSEQGSLFEKAYSLSHFNDTGKSFDEIADIIEKHWKQL